MIILQIEGHAAYRCTGAAALELIDIWMRLNSDVYVVNALGTWVPCGGDEWINLGVGA